MLNTGDDWEKMLRDKTAKKLVFKLGKEELYLTKIHPYDCQAGYWNYMDITDEAETGYQPPKQNVAYLRKMLNDNYLYMDKSVDIACHFSEYKREFNFAGVRSVRQRGDTLYIYIEETK